LVAEYGRGSVTVCEVVNNAEAGIEVTTGGNPLLQRCRLGYNGCVGAFIHEQGSATLEGCDLTDNVAGAWSVEAGCSVTNHAAATSLCY
jgi:F-box protein 11